MENPMRLNPPVLIRLPILSTQPIFLFSTIIFTFISPCVLLLFQIHLFLFGEKKMREKLQRKFEKKY